MYVRVSEILKVCLEKMPMSMVLPMELQGYVIIKYNSSYVMDRYENVWLPRICILKNNLFKNQNVKTTTLLIRYQHCNFIQTTYQNINLARIQILKTRDFHLLASLSQKLI